MSPRYGTSSFETRPKGRSSGLGLSFSAITWNNDVHCRQTGAAAAASPEMAVVRQARTDPDDRVRRAVFWIFAVRHGRYRHADHRQPLAVAAGGHLDAVHLCDLHRCCGRHAAQRSSLSDGGLRGDAWHAAPDRRILIRVVVLAVAGVLIYYGYINYLRGFGSFRLPSNTPIASLYAAIPLSGALIALFTVEQLVNGIRNGFDHPEPLEDANDTLPADTSIQNRVQP